jgi:hypothetical protein
MAAMRTKKLMSVSAALMGTGGLVATFLPQEALAYHRLASDGASVLLVQTVGALLLGFAIQNWSARGNLMGGIYSRPLTLGNFMYLLMMTITLARMAIEGAQPQLFIWLGMHALLAAWFGAVLFGPTPVRDAR